MTDWLAAVQRMPAPRRRGALTVLALVVLAHALLLAARPDTAPGGDRSPRRAVLTLVWRPAPATPPVGPTAPTAPTVPTVPTPPERPAPVLAPPRPAAEPPAAAAPHPRPLPAAPDPPPPAAIPDPARAPMALAPAGPASAAGPRASAPPLAPPTPAGAAPERLDAFDADEAADMPAPGERAPPRYPTRVPAPAELRFALRRGPLLGEATLRWQREGQRYTLAFDAHAPWRGAQRMLIEQHSEGTVDAHGLQPERFTDRRRARSAQAARFLRDEGRIVSGPAGVQWPAWPGAQDRLGWIVQLAGIHAEAAAQGREAPAEVTLFVVGARGGAGIWTFRREGVETLQTPLGPVAALRLRREPERLEDLRVEAWLDPARGHWPVRLRLTPLRGGAPLELELAGEPAPP